MKKVSHSVLIEDDYPGCTIGAIVLPYGTIQIDAPPSPEDVRMYRASLMGLKTGAERILINLDSHLDRVLGAKLMDCPIIMHEKTAELIKARPGNVKLQGEDTGSDWESVNGIGNVRWAPPEITFTRDMNIHWSDTPVRITHHPGCNPGAAWVEVPSEKVLFIGDTIVKNQPAFYGNANLHEWIVSVEYLADHFPGYHILSGRGGEIKPDDIRKQSETLRAALKILGPVLGEDLSAEKIDALADSIFALETYPNKYQTKYLQRVRYGVKQYMSTAG
ncbi:MAG TPA: MBL fold metallo-hydrolase [Anaerolineales bacterium]|nr:MBL fold metallo-hydrolase [Anaerolineales bacterium]